MASKYLGRDDAPFGPGVWGALDGAMRDAAKNELVARRMLPLEGPYGLGLKALPLEDGTSERGLIISRLLPVPLLWKTFSLGVRDLASFEREGLALDVRPVIETAVAVARLEDETIFRGAPALPGLMHAEGASQVALSAWDQVGQAANDLIRAITTLDDAGFHGPYALALAPEPFNLLFRLYPERGITELEHLREMAADGVFKAATLEQGGVLVSAQCASLVLGQDMAIGFIGPADDRFEFSVSESLTLRILRPKGIGILR